jgi:cytochrome b6-f complex iron-sulfur subunit
MAEKKKLSVAEMLAAARKQGAVGTGGGGDAAPPAPKEDAPAAPPEPVAEAPAEAAAETPVAAPPPKPAAPKPAGGKMSVADMMAAARAAGAAGKAPAAAAPKPAEKKEAPKPAAAAAKEKPTAPVVGGPKDTSSILAALRKGPKPGPMTKAEAAAKEKVEPATAKQKPTVPPMPVKPEYAKPKAPKAEEETRRGFISLMMGSMLSLGYTCLAAVGGLWTLGFARYLFPNILTEPPSKFKVGFPSDFAPGKVEEKFKAQFGVWIVNTEYAGQQEICAIRTVCTHLGCTPNWLEAEQKFKCPCHGSGFYKDGINFEGPAPRPLERYAISLSDDGQLEVDKGKLFFEEMGQWSDPSSYYPA